MRHRRIVLALLVSFHASAFADQTLPPRKTCFVPIMSFAASPLENQPMAVRDEVSGCATAGVAYGDPSTRQIIFAAQDACRRPDGSTGPLLGTLFFEAQYIQGRVVSHPSPESQCAYEAPVGTEKIGVEWSMNPYRNAREEAFQREEARQPR